MNRSIIWLAACMLAFALACGDEANDAADTASEAAASATDVASDAAGAAMDKASDAAGAAADAATSLAGDAVAACRAAAESGAWDTALEVCKKAHEMLPDDLAIEHAYQQAQAAAK